MSSKYTSEDVRLKYIDQDGLNLRHCLDTYKTLILCMTAVAQNGNALIYVPWKHRTKEICNIAINNENNTLKNLCHIPKELLDRNLCEVSVGANGTNLVSVPRKLKTPEMCNIAVDQDGMALSHVPEKLKTEELCDKAIDNDGNALHYVPGELLTKKRCKYAIERNLNAVKYVPGYLNKSMRRFIKKLLKEREKNKCTD
jgi:hypothetical protein